MRTHNKKEMDWPHPGRRLTTKNSYQKKMMRYWMMAVALLYMESLKMRPSSETSGDFDQMNLLRKQIIGWRTSKLEILFDTELMT